MLQAIKDWQRFRELKRTLKPFWQEVDQNWELWHVMDQRQVIDRFFNTEAWSNAVRLAKVDFSDNVRQYAKEIQEYNDALIESNKYEKWYISNPENKTKDNAKELHAKKAAVKHIFYTLKDPINNAREHLTERLLSLGIIK